MYSRTDCSQWDPIQMNKFNNKSKTTSQSVKQLRREVNNLRKRVTNNAPVAISTKSGNQGKDYYHTKGVERVSDVSAVSTAYAVTGVFLNAANPGLFPWLSGIAKKYDLYRFKKLIFRYKPSLPTSEAGNVYLGIDYNTLDPAPPSSTDFCQLSHWSTNVVWKPQSLQAKCPSNDWFYTRSGSVPNADYKTYDIGKFFLAVENISYLNTVGYIEVDYEVEFARRQPDYVSTQPPVGDVLLGIFSFPRNTSLTSGPLVFTTEVYNNSQGDVSLNSAGTVVSIDKPGTFEVIYSNSSGNNMTFQVDSTSYGLAGFHADKTIIVVNSSSTAISILHSGTTTTDGPSYLIIRQVA